MINIQVLSHGLIPRNQGLGPRLEPFPCDFETIKIIINSGMTVRAKNPMTGGFITLNHTNLKRLYDTFSNYKPNSEEKKADKVNTTPDVTPVPVSKNTVTAESVPAKVDQKQNNGKKNDKKSSDPIADMVEKAFTDNTPSIAPLKVITNPDEK